MFLRNWAESDFLLMCYIRNKTFLNPSFSTNKIKWWIPIKVKPRFIQIKLDRRIEKSADHSRIELFQSAMVNMGINHSHITSQLGSEAVS